MLKSQIGGHGAMNLSPVTLPVTILSSWHVLKISSKSTIKHHSSLMKKTPIRRIFGQRLKNWTKSFWRIWNCLLMSPNDLLMGKDPKWFHVLLIRISRENKNQKSKKNIALIFFLNWIFLSKPIFSLSKVYLLVLALKLKRKHKKTLTLSRAH